MWKFVENYNSLYEVNEKGMTNKELAKKYNCSNALIATRKYQLKKGRI